MLRFSEAETAIGKGSEMLSFLCTESRVVLDKNDAHATKASSSADVSATETLGN